MNISRSDPDESCSKCVNSCAFSGNFTEHWARQRNDIGMLFRWQCCKYRRESLARLAGFRANLVQFTIHPDKGLSFYDHFILSSWNHFQSLMSPWRLWDRSFCWWFRTLGAFSNNKLSRNSGNASTLCCFSKKCVERERTIFDLLE